MARKAAVEKAAKSFEQTLWESANKLWSSRVFSACGWLVIVGTGSAGVSPAV